MIKYLVIFICLMTAFSPVSAEERALFDIREFCRMPEDIAKNNLPVEIDLFEVKEIENPKYGHEEVWSLKSNEILTTLGITMLRIEIHQNIVQSVWFKYSNELQANLAIVGLLESDLSTEYGRRVKNKDGYVIGILGNGDYYQCFEYHAGH